MVTDTKPTTLLRESLASLKAYGVADARGLIKLDAMENPYPWPAALKEAWVEEVGLVAMNRYPDPQATAVVEALRATFGISSRHRILLGNGSDELIQLLLLALVPGSVVMSPEPSFAMYRLVSQGLGLQYRGVPLAPEDFSLDADAFCAAMEQHRPGLVFLAYPNNPTGNLFPREAMEEIIDRAPGIVVVDEAYEAFAGTSFMADLDTRARLFVLRTVSKAGLAGLRLGYLVGDPTWLGEYDKLRLPYNINALSQHAVEFALRHYEVFAHQTGLIRQERDRMYEALRGVNHIRVWRSEANFHLIRVPAGRGSEVACALREAGILIRDFSAGGEALRDCLRLTVGTPDENNALLAALAAVL